VAATLKSIDYNVAMTFILNNNNNNNNNNNGAMKLKIYNYIDIGKYLRACQNVSARGPPGCAGLPNVNFGPP